MFYLGYIMTISMCSMLALSLVSASPITKMGRTSPLKLPSLQPLHDYALLSASNGISTKLGDVVSTKTVTSKGSSQRGCLVVFMTHLADLSSFEVAQQLNYYLPQFQNDNIRVSTIAPGASVENAQLFCKLTNFPIENLFLDTSAALYKNDLPFSKGFLPEQASLSPYFKLLPMLMGVGSKGTIPEVLRGYFGDKTAPAAWIRESLRLVDTKKFDVLGENYQRPFELATMRLQNMQDVLTNWNNLVPNDNTLLTQLGGAYVLSETGDVLYEHLDTGILTYVDLRRAARYLDLTLVD